MPVLLFAPFYMRRRRLTEYSNRTALYIIKVEKIAKQCDLYLHSPLVAADGVCKACRQNGAAQTINRRNLKMKKAKTAKMKKRVLGTILAGMMVLQALSAVTAADADLETKVANSETKNSLAEMAALMTSTTYATYLIEHENDNVSDKTEEVVVEAVDYKEDETTAAVKVKENFSGSEGASLLTPNSGYVTWEFDVKEDGFYNIELLYFPYRSDPTEPDEGEEYLGKTAAMERIIKIDGRVPFKEARNLSFSRAWLEDYSMDGFVAPEKFYKIGTSIADADNDSNAVANDSDVATEYRQAGRYFKYDYYLNEIRPEKKEADRWLEKRISDSSAFYDSPFEFYFSAGTHTVTLEATREPMLIKEIRITPPAKTATYSELAAEYEKKGYAEAATDKLVKLDGEFPEYTSEQVIYAVNDRTSPITDPQHASAIVLNSIGGEKWEIAGQWIEWDFEVPENGLYNIVPRFLQNVNAGLFSSRKLLIYGGDYNGVPFEEAKRLRFNYSDAWQVEPLGNDEGAYEFYFEKGVKYTIRLEVVLGEMGSILREVDESLVRMNDYYRKIVMITGTDPDTYLDYNFSQLIPDVLRGMRQEAALLTSVSSELEAIIGEKGEQSVILDKVAYLLDLMGHNQDKVAGNLDQFKSYNGSLGTWLLTCRNQPLTLDFITIQPASAKLPKAKANFFESIGHEFSAFINSFFTNYNSVGATEELDGRDDVLEVWITTGRDQAQIIRQMVSEFSMQEDNPPVNLKLIAAGTLLPATLAGTGPDVSMDGDPVGYGVRNAVLNLNDRSLHESGAIPREELEEVKTWFNSEAFVPLTVYNPDYIPRGDELDEEYSMALYALPETMSFPMFFYRKDIFTEFDLKVPETWDDVYDLIKVLSAENMEMGLSQALTQIRMYQQGEPWYKGNNIVSEGMATNLDSDVALEAFKNMTDIFTQYRQPVTFDFANRFRTGEMPCGIADYLQYNQLKVFAPEIDGLWEFVQLPGTPRVADDGTEYVDHTSPSGVVGIMIMRDAENINDAWKYIKWWVSAEVQSRYGNEQVATIGTAAKYNTANISALLGQSWSANEVANLRQQFDSLKGTPMTPGNYIVARNTNFAFLAVYNDDASPVEAMLGYINDINKELTRKRNEYDFRTASETLEEYRAEQEERLGVDNMDYITNLTD